MEVRNPGTISMDEIQRYIGQLNLELEASRLRQEELLSKTLVPSKAKEKVNGS